MFLLRQIFGFRRKPRGSALLFLVLGGFACVSGGMLGVIGLPFSFYRAWQVSALPRPQPGQLEATTAGSRILVTAQLPSDTATSAHGLLLYYVEERQPPPDPDRGERETPGAPSAGWHLEQAPPSSFDLFLANGVPLTIHIPSQTSFLNAQQIENQPAEESRTQRRYVGYLPGQTLTVEGTWEGQHGLTATAIYGGLPEDYENYLRYTRPIQSLVGAVCCSLLGLALIGGGVVWRIVG